MKKNIITGITLASFALICALLLGLVNYFTAPIIDKRNQKEIQESISIVCPGYDKDTMILIEDERTGAKKVYKIYLNDSLEYIIYLIDNQGYASTISMMISIDKNLSITGYKIISQNETKGDTTKHNFNMNGKKNLDDFDSLSGSTFSSNAIKKSFNDCFSFACIDFKEVNNE